MKKNNYSAIFFDAADTLFYIKKGLGKAYSDIANKYGVYHEHKNIETAFSNSFKSAPPLAFGDAPDVKRRILEKNWWYEVVKNAFSELGMFDEFDSYFDELFEYFRVDAWELFPDTIDILSFLKMMGLRTALVSNFDSRVYEVCEVHGILGYFDVYIISSEVGFAKPSPEIFKITLDRLGVKPEDCLHVGDSHSTDVLGAISVGIEPVLLDRSGKHADKQNIIIINNLNELKSILLSKMDRV